MIRRLPAELSEIRLIEYRGYRATVSYEPASGAFVGVLQGIPDRVTFSGRSVEELKREIARAVDNYVEFCIEWGRSTDPSYVSDLTVRVSPELERLVG